MMMTIEEYRAAIYQILVDAKNEDGTPVLSEKEAREALNGFTDDELQDGILWDTPEDVAGIILEGSAILSTAIHPNIVQRKCLFLLTTRF